LQVHPGPVATQFTQKAGGILSVMSRILRPIMKSPEVGARTPIYLATSPEIARITGGYFVNCKQKRTAAITYDRAMAEKHWEISESPTSLNSGAGRSGAKERGEWFGSVDAVDVHFLADQMNITVCELDDWKELPICLQRLKSAIANPQACSTGWSFTVDSGPTAKDDLDIVRRDAPLRPGPHEVIALVARRDEVNNRPVLQGAYAELDRKYPSLHFIGKHTVKYGDAEIYALTARPSGSEDDVSPVHPTSNLQSRRRSSILAKVIDGCRERRMMISPGAPTRSGWCRSPA
jgi:hypothetical protein